jgi:LysM repeat protein
MRGMIGPEMVGRNTARFVAPVALVVIAVGAYLIVTQHLNSSSPASSKGHLVGSRPRARGRYARASSYTVQPGENLTAISSKTGIPVQTLEQLNPSLDPNSLQTGQRLRLRQ